MVVAEHPRWRRTGRACLRAVVAAVLAAGLLAGALPSAPPTAALGNTPRAKAVIIVGATEGVTPSYIRDANVIARQLTSLGATVVKIYSPRATWSAVRTSTQGANLVIYLGHGNGWPNPYRSTTDPRKDNGFGLNLASAPSNNVKRYYGEYFIRQLKLAPGAVVILNHLCYAAGSSEPGKTPPTVAVAHQRADNYASGFLAAGAKVVMATASTPDSFIASLFASSRSMRAAFWAMPSTVHTYVRLSASHRSVGRTVLQTPFPRTRYWDAITGTLSYTAAQWRATWR